MDRYNKQTHYYNNTQSSSQSSEQNWHWKEILCKYISSNQSNTYYLIIKSNNETNNKVH